MKTLRPGVLTAAVMCAALGACVLAMRGLHAALRRPRPPARWAPTARPAPGLQVDPPQDLAALRAWEKQTLDSYAWIDRRAGVIRIPIERAMAIQAAREKGR